MDNAHETFKRYESRFGKSTPKFLGVSKDMIDDKPGPNFPKRWRSSIAAFYDEPTENFPECGDRKITSLKIVCTITNYQLAQAERSTDYGWYE